MNKAELINQLAEKVDINKKQAEDAIDAITQIITEKLKVGEEVTITGFGAFSSRIRAARAGVNPRNPSEKIQVPEVRVPKFKAGKALKDALKSS